jgi:hypothetical protein
MSIKLKKLLTERQFGEPLPTLKSVAEKHQSKTVYEGTDPDLLKKVKAYLRNQLSPSGGGGAKTLSAKATAFEPLKKKYRIGGLDDLDKLNDSKLNSFLKDAKSAMKDYRKREKERVNKILAGWS